MLYHVITFYLEQYLSDKDAGESIMRPSSKGPSFLTLTLKIFDGVYAHKDIAEGGKDLQDMTSLLRLGKSLTIDTATFENLDEVSMFIYYIDKRSLMPSYTDKMLLSYTVYSVKCYSHFILLYPRFGYHFVTA